MPNKVHSAKTGAVYITPLLCYSISRWEARNVQKCNMVWRGAVYLAGMTLLALGITLTTLAGRGASAIVSVPYTISCWSGLSFANLTLVFYCLFVAAEFIIKGKQRRWLDALQVPVSIVFTRFMALFQHGIRYQSGYLPTDLAVLAGGVVFTGIGAAMAVDMMLIPNPGDGIVSSISMRSGKELGLCKNCFDLGCVATALLLGTCAGAPLMGIGLGTVLSMLGVGRVMAVFNRLACKLLKRLAGLDAA